MEPEAEQHRPSPSLWSRMLPWLILAGLTLYAGISRFIWIDHPTLWGDELATYYRTAGDFDHLMDRLKQDGFVPLHYIAYWALGERVVMTPFWMRLIPAMCGTLLVPAVFLLARQFFPRKTALLAAALTAASAWAMTYSRDAKMYMDTWLFVTLGVALLMVWLRQTGWRSLAVWPLWVVCAAASVWLHATAMTIVAMYPIFLLMRLPKIRWYQKDLFILGMLAVLAGPWWYYTQYNTYIERSGIVAIETDSNGSQRSEWGRSGISWVAQHNEGQSPWQLALNCASGYLVGLQWPRDGHQDPWNAQVQPAAWFWVVASIVMSLVIGVLVLGMLPWAKRWRGEGGATLEQTREILETDVIRASRWRGPALLAVWLIGPTYGVYCRSFGDFVPPWDWLGWCWSLLGAWWALVPVVAWWAVMGMNRWRRVAWVLGAAAGLLVATALAIGVVRGGTAWLGPAWGFVSLPYLLIPWAAAVAALMWRACGESERERCMALLRLIAICAVVFACLVIAYGVMRYLHGRAMVKDPGGGWQSIWMPRYLGIVCPAVLVAAAGLLMRLPTRPVRWAAITLLIGLNVTQGWARLLVDTETPTARIASDVIQSPRGDDATTRVAFNIPRNAGHAGHWYHLGLGYYIAAQTGYRPGPDGLHDRELRRNYKTSRDKTPEKLKADLDRYPQIRRLIVWEMFPDSVTQDAFDGRDPCLDVLGPSWRLESTERFGLRQFWNWRWLGWCRRRVYVKVAEPEQADRPRPIASTHPE